MNLPPWTNAYGEDGRHQHEIARIMGPVADIAELKNQGIIHIRPLLVPTDADPQWLYELLDYIEHLNADIQSSTVEFPSPDMQKVTIMRNFTIAEQTAIVTRLIRSKLKGIVQVQQSLPHDILES